MRGHRTRVLVLSAQFPYPATWGFATRVHELAKQLTASYDVTLLSYASVVDRDHVEDLQQELDVVVVPHEPASWTAKRAAQLASVASTRPFQSRIVHSAAMQQAIDELCATRDYGFVQLESSVLCSFRIPHGPRVVLDEHNLEYELFRRMGDGERSAPRRAFSELEHLRMRRFERRAWSRVDACAVTSEREARIVRAHVPATPVAVVPNGADLEQFAPDPDVTVEPYTVVFNGNLEYRPNLDAAWFLVDEVWPRVTARFPAAQLTIVGAGRPSDIRNLQRDGLTVTGRVAAVQPYLARAAIVAVPIRMAGGTRLKVVEALALGKPIVSTTIGFEGIDAVPGTHLVVGDTAESFASHLNRLFFDRASAEQLGRHGRELVEREYSWDHAGARLRDLYGAITMPRPHDRRIVDVSTSSRPEPAEVPAASRRRLHLQK
jgi:glycosyltransferase involved in cell wall biosynthesis